MSKPQLSTNIYLNLMPLFNGSLKKGVLIWPFPKCCHDV